MHDPSGLSKGSGFVSFSGAEEASRAVSSCGTLILAFVYILLSSSCILTVKCLLLKLLELNGKIVGNKPLYVALAKRKEDRRARLQVCFESCTFMMYLKIKNNSNKENEQKKGMIDPVLKHSLINDIECNCLLSIRLDYR